MKSITTFTHRIVLLALISLFSIFTLSLPVNAATADRPSAQNTGPRYETKSINLGGGFNNVSNKTFEKVAFAPLPSGQWYTFEGNNVTFRDCIIPGQGVIFRGNNIRIEHCNISGGAALSSASKVVFEYNNVHSFDDGLHITSDAGARVKNVDIRHNFIHDPAPSCGAHSDGIQIRGAENLTITDNVIDMGKWKLVCGQDALNAAVFGENANGGNKNVTLANNYLNGGGYTLRLNKGANQRITGNSFGSDDQYGLVLNNAGKRDLVDTSNNIQEATGKPVIIKR